MKIKVFTGVMKDKTSNTMLLGSIAQFSAAETTKPEDVISSITQEIINEIKNKPDLASNLGINQLVDKKVANT